MENSKKKNIINPFVEPSLSYFEFGNSNKQLNALLPRINLPKDNLDNHKINYGLTSPGTLNNPMECSGLDFMNTSTFDKKELVFSQCLNKFMNKFQMPQLTFENLLNNLPYTFSALNEQEQKEVIKRLEEFIERIKEENKKETFKNEKILHNKIEYMNDTNITNYVILSVILATSIIVILYALR